MIKKEQLKVPLFSPDGDDSVDSRLMWGGSTTNLAQLNDVRFSWAIQLYQQMRECFWLPQKIDITSDLTDYHQLTNHEKRAYDGVLSYLTFLDSIQTVNIPYLKSPITAPEAALCLAEQISQEGLHNASYQYVIESVIDQKRRSQVYDFWREDKVLRNRCEYIANIYQSYVDDPTPEKYFYALLGDYLLEALYFYNGFILFYSFANRSLMSGTADVIKLINRDELNHVRLYQKLITESFSYFPYSTEKIYEMFDQAIHHEITWTNHICENQILGISEHSVEQYTKYLANIRIKAIGLEPLYPEITKSPYQHLEKIADISNDGHSKGNFFETTVTSYNMASAVEGWSNF